MPWGTTIDCIGEIKNKQPNGWELLFIPTILLCVIRVIL
jgi:hypothetical protein